MRKIVFVTGTRADYGKLKALMMAIEKQTNFNLQVFVTGMHMLEKYGSTYREIVKDGFENIYPFVNTRDTQSMDITLSNTIVGFSNYVEEFNPDLIVVHGDRVEALAGAIVGALNNIKVAHIEGGEISGTIDESIRHAITKFAHIHLVANEEAAQRIIQLGEREESIFIIGSPDIDVMKSSHLPTLEQAKERYEIPFESFAILIFHPVTTEIDDLEEQIGNVIKSIKMSGDNFIIIYPNNDSGSHIIFKAFDRLNKEETVRLFPSLRFEYFLTLLKNAQYIIGNSSAGIREAGVYGIPAIDIGNRQKGRYTKKTAPHVTHVESDVEYILQVIKEVKNNRYSAESLFGKGDSAEHFLEVINNPLFWNYAIQKQLVPR